jgi:hypothetical protein
VNTVLFVTFFLLILGAISHSYFENYHTFHFEAKATEGYFMAMRNMRSDREKKNAEKFKKEKPKTGQKGGSKPTPPPPQEQRTPLCNRYHYPPNKRGKLSLFPLMKLGKESSSLHETVLTYLSRLYKHTSFYNPQLMSSLLEALIKKGKELQSKNQPLSFIALYPDEQNLRSLYYKLLRGTQKYSFTGKDQGIPPLTDFFSLEKKREPLINFTFAPIVLLDALFGEKLAEKIHSKESEKASEKEKKKKQLPTLSQVELEALLKEVPPPFLEFSLAKGEEIASGEDESGMGIVVREKSD